MWQVKPCAGQVAVQPVPARARLVDEHERSALGLELPEERVDVALPRADWAQGHDLGPAVLRRVGDGDGLLVDIETTGEGFGRVFHG